LLDGGGLDALPYAKESGPAMNRILLDVYGIDLLSPPEDALHGGVVPDASNKGTWQGYSRAKWQAIRQTYDVTQVVTDESWTLDLPVTAQGHGMRLYRIPQP